MFKITLNKIKAHDPCADGWKTLLKSKPGVYHSEEFTVADILDSNGLDDTIWVLRCLPEYDNLWRKYAVWCAQRVQHLMKDPRSFDAIEVAWRHSEGEATDEELAAAWAAARAAAWAAAWAADDSADDAAWAAAWAARAAAWAADDSAADAAWAARAAAAEDAARAARAAAAWAAARAAAAAAARAAARVVADSSADAARAAQAEKLRQILTSGKWVN